ncbi:TetR/AcrR family transcriptional regulator [Cupriavidus sp. WKF15]|uniref:TetR/AcrR family transcriptional regulator n=1 Tax=Cupriavidus sp. WKF15 TaxID=3032282 RepID=UPI0023E0BDF9|nr:TetR/AcrR family transcriptional regulator [Cupriavidus sp. WKF15]WER48755.1 TetR/AcrR family transcriptional regulator [Cupriavidus sp. WKF15]
MTEDTEDLSAQSRLLEATEQLIYSGGIHATGMDAIVKASGVARKSIYRLYPTKEALVSAALKNRDERWMAWFMRSTPATGEAFARVMSIFPAMRQWFESEGFHGCAFINATGETEDPQSEIRAVSRFHKQRLLAYLNELTQACGLPDPGETARQLLVLIDGATAVAMVSGDASAADSAGRAAAVLLESSRSVNGPSSSHH